MKRQEKNEIYSIRKFKVGVGSALIGLSFLGATGLVNDVPVIGDVFGVKEAHAGSFGESFTVSIEFGQVVYDGDTHTGGNYGGGTSVTGSYGTNNYWQFTVTPPPGYEVVGQSSFSGYGTAPSFLNVQIRPVNQPAPKPNPVTPTQPTDSPKVTRYQGDESRELGDESRDYSNGVTLIKKGTKPTVTRTSINFTTRYVKDPDRKKGAENITQTEGRAGEIVRTVRHTVDSETGVVSDLPAEETRTEPTNKVVKVAAKDKVETLTRGRQTIEKRTVYTVNENTGDITESVSERVIKEITYKDNPKSASPAGTKEPISGTDQVGVSTKPDVVEESIPFSTSYEPNIQAERDVRSDKVAGKNGKTIKTTTYTMNPETGGVTANAPTTDTEPPVNRIVLVGTKPKTVTEVIASPKQYVKDPDREKGQRDIETPGTPGSKSITTTYDLNRQTGVITDRVGSPVITQPTPTIVKIAAKDKVVSTPIASPKRYEADTTKEFGSPNTEEAGKAGSDVATTVYTVNLTTGVITEETTTQHTDPTVTVVKVGAKDKVVNRKDDQGRSITETTTYKVNPDTGEVTPTTTTRYNGKDSTVEKRTIPSPKQYVKDPSREKGAENIEEKGKDGEETITTTYTIDSTSGATTPVVGEPVKTVDPTPTIVKVGAKDKVVEKELPSRVRYVGDESKENSTEPVRTEGKKGKEVTTTTYAVDPKTGTISESDKTERTEEPTDTVVTIGTKPKVELIKDGDKTIERTTRYKVNEDTGEVVTTTTDKLLSSNGEGVLPPVVEVPEFNGGVNGDLDGNAVTHDLPEYTGPLAGNGLTGDGEIVEPPILDIPEYTGPLAGNGLTGDGEIVEPPILNVPEFDLNKLPKEEPKQEVPNVGTGLNSFNDGRKKTAQATEIVPVASTKEEPKVETPKDVSTPVTLEQKDNEQGKQAPVQTASSKKEMKELPNTGTASNATLTLAGVTFALFGIAMISKKKD